ncbi:conserved Plasmodium protein, unknown function [Plasmodium gallinaceum]|uniref:Inner centromere protein ARK-binding domain-containing protein n=1 Tax=Plasmodium gallinaceum TaxID=5849 RepID=A0A1J1GRH8_PLAGA|nr:conserved Plasmodium protein, unknown function [Plasmodium gallinaceum]CRG95113.1 conserved Plasmodium protein, unknown function [Plasmodium gallinaceum]
MRRSINEKRDTISLNRKIDTNIQKSISKYCVTSKRKYNFQRIKKYKHKFKENLEYTKMKNNLKNNIHTINRQRTNLKKTVCKDDILNKNNINSKFSINNIKKEGNSEKEKENYKMCKNDNVFDYKKYYERVDQWKKKRCIYFNNENKIKKKEIHLENKKRSLREILNITEPKKNTKRNCNKYESSLNQQKTTNKTINKLNEIQLKKKNVKSSKNEININNYINYNDINGNNENNYDKYKKNVVPIYDSGNYQGYNIDNKTDNISNNYINYSNNNNRHEIISHNNSPSFKLPNNKIRITNKNKRNIYCIGKIKSSDTMLENEEKNIYSNKTITDTFDYIDCFNNFATNPTFLIKSNETIFHAPLKSNLNNVENKSNFNLFDKTNIKKSYTNYSTKVRTIPNLNMEQPAQNEKIRKNKKENSFKGILKNEYLDNGCKIKILKYTNNMNITNMQNKLENEIKKNENMKSCKNSYINYKGEYLINFHNEEEMKKKKKQLLKNVKTSIYNERNIFTNNHTRYNNNDNFLIKNELVNNNKKDIYKPSYTLNNCNVSSILNIKNPFTCVYKNVKSFKNFIVDKKEVNKEKGYCTSNNITLCDKKKYISENIRKHLSYMNINKKQEKNIKNSKVLEIEGDKIYPNENLLFKNNIQIEQNTFKNFNLDMESYDMKHSIFECKKNAEENFKNKKYLKKLNKFHKKKKEKNLISLENSHKIEKEKLCSDNNYRSLDLNNELLNVNKHKKLVHIEEKDIKRNFDIFLCLFMKYEKNESFLFCLISDEELTKYSFFYHNYIKPFLDDYKKSKLEKLKKEEGNSAFRDYNCISLNKIILEIMIPSIRNNYLKYLNELYNKKENNTDISSSDELQKEIREINKKIKNFEIRSLDKHKKEISIKSICNYENKIKLLEKPKWSNKRNLKKLLRKQQNYNPFTIFGTSIKEVNLEEIFTLEVYNNYVTNEDRFQNKILHELYVGDYIKNLYKKIDCSEWFFVLDSLKKNWKYFANLECNMLLDPLLLEEILWYIDNNKMYKDKSKEIYIYETCFCPTPDPAKEINLNDAKHFYKSMASKYTSHNEMKHKKLSLNEENSYSSNLIFKYDDMNREHTSLYMKKKKEILTKENLFFNIPRPSSAIYYNSDFFQNKVKKHTCDKKIKTNNQFNVVSPKCVEDAYFPKFKSKKWISQKFFDNFFLNYYLYNFNGSNRKYNSVI